MEAEITSERCFSDRVRGLTEFNNYKGLPLSTQELYLTNGSAWAGS